MVAFVGSDGAGKSTVSADLQKWLRWKADCNTVYFGSKDAGYRFAQKVFRVERSRAAKKKSTTGGNKKENRTPTLWTAFRTAHAANGRRRNQLRAQKMLNRGQIVIADRFPQFEVSGTFDGPSGVDPAQVPFYLRPFYWYERRTLSRLRMLRPDLLIRLTVPASVAIARKPDHDPESIERKVALTNTLSFDGAPSVDIDCTKPLDEVCLQVRNLVWSTIRAASSKETS